MGVSLLGPPVRVGEKAGIRGPLSTRTVQNPLLMQPFTDVVACVAAARQPGQARKHRADNAPRLGPEALEREGWCLSPRVELLQEVAVLPGAAARLALEV